MGSNWWLVASLACAAGAVVASVQIEPPPEEEPSYLPRSVCELVEHGPHADRAGEVAAARARAGVDAYLARATSIPEERSMAIATALRRGVDDPCRLGVSPSVRWDLTALELPPALPMNVSALRPTEVTVLQPIGSAFTGIRAVERSEDVTLGVVLDLRITRDPVRRIGALEALGGELTVRIHDERGRADVAVLHHTLELPEGAAPPEDAPADGATPYAWMVAQLLEAAGVAARADLGL